MITESASTATISSARLIEGFQADCRLRGMAPGSIPRYLSVIRIFSEYLDGRRINRIEVDRDILRGFLEYLRPERNVSHKTLENYFTVLSSLFEYLAYEGCGNGSCFASSKAVSKVAIKKMMKGK